MAAAGQAGREEYVKLVLTDRPMTPEIGAYFQAFFQARGSVLMERVSLFRRFDAPGGAPEADALRARSVEELFADFYTERCGGASPDAEDLELMRFAGEIMRSGAATSEGADKLLAFLAKGGASA